MNYELNKWEVHGRQINLYLKEVHNHLKKNLGNLGIRGTTVSISAPMTTSHPALLSHSLHRHQIEKRIRTLPEIDGLSKETVVTSWMSKYDFIMKGEPPLPNPIRIPSSRGLKKQKTLSCRGGGATSGAAADHCDAWQRSSQQGAALRPISADPRYQKV